MPMEQLVELGWIQVQNDGLTIILRKEKQAALDHGRDLSKYWVQVSAVVELLQRKP